MLYNNSTVLGTSRNSNLVRDLPGPARTFLVSLVLDRHGKEKELINFPEMLRAVNTYTAQIGWPGFSREEGLKAFDALHTYSLLQGGVTKYHPLGNRDEVKTRSEVYFYIAKLTNFCLYLSSYDIELPQRSRKFYGWKDWSLSIEHIWNR